MAAQSTIEQLILYYANLLIIQYNNKPKAQAEMQLVIAQLIASAVYLDVLNGYDIDTAIGAQLDIIGKYVGIDRFYAQEDLANYFGFTYYGEADPDATPKFGFSTYATFNGFSYNGTLVYDEIITEENALSDDDFRVLIKLAILQNTCGDGQGEIDQGVFAIFGDQIRPESFGYMKMFYFIVGPLSPLIQAIISKKLLPKPMGVQLTYVQENSGPMFGFIGYDGIEQPFENGFTDYAHYGTTSGRVLTYDQIIEA